MNNYFYPTVSEETFAAWLDGSLSPEEEREFMNEAAHNAEIQELLDANDQVEDSYEQMIHEGYVMPDEFNTDFQLPEIYNPDDEVEPYDVESDVEPYEVDDDDDDDDSDTIDTNIDDQQIHDTTTDFEHDPCEI
ncbi:MAG: hypothetical protein ACI30R_05930 [Sodaliphilus sp.]